MSRWILVVVASLCWRGSVWSQSKEMDQLVLQPVSFQKPSFSPQFGIGLSLIPARGHWDVRSGNGMYHGGWQLDFMWRLSRWVTLDLGGSVLLSDQRNAESVLYKELGAYVDFKFFLRDPHARRFGSSLTPYVLLGFSLDGVYPSLTYSISQRSDVFSYHFEKSYPLLYVGPYIGLGLELRLGRHFALTGDVRTFAQGVVDAYGADGGQHHTRVGIRATVGVATYFN